MSLPGPDDSEEPPTNPGHPSCAEHAGSDYCREYWQLHLAGLRRRPETHWHKCDYDQLCALVPVVYHGHCLAVVRLACPSTTPEAAFEREVELLDILVRDFVTSEADFLERLSRTERAVDVLNAPPANGASSCTEQRTSNSLILQALKYVEEHLSDPALTVGRAAREVGVHPNYLSHLFADQVGQRMSQFIASRRVERAKTLLASTTFQIKRIARDTGHANPNWFCYVFRALIGLSPSAYRSQSRG